MYALDLLLTTHNLIFSFKEYYSKSTTFLFLKCGRRMKHFKNVMFTSTKNLQAEKIIIASVSKIIPVISKLLISPLKQHSWRWGCHFVITCIGFVRTSMKEWVFSSPPRWKRNDKISFIRLTFIANLVCSLCKRLPCCWIKWWGDASRSVKINKNDDK